MKFKTHTRVVPGEYDKDGNTRKVVEKAPILPPDWQTIALRSAVSIVLTLTLIAVGWSTWSIGELLGGGIGYGAAVIYDMGWAIALILEYLARYDKNKRGFPKKLGWALLVITMGAIFWHGIERESIAMGIFGAGISLFAKLMWMGVMKHINADLTDRDRDYLAEMTSKAKTQAAIAQVRRTSSRIEQHAELERLAMEREKLQMMQAYGIVDTIEVEQTADVPVPEIAGPTVADLGKGDAIRFVMRQLPDVDPEDVHRVLQEHRDDIDLKYVRTVISRTEAEPEAEVIELHK